MRVRGAGVCTLVRLRWCLELGARRSSSDDGIGGGSGLDGVQMVFMLSRCELSKLRDKLLALLDRL